MKISVIVPVYNLEKYIRQCLESVLNQTYRDLELIVVDDGSQDGSVPVCREIAAADQRVRVIENRHDNQATARNTGVRQASGDYIIFLDGDDFWADSGALERLAERLGKTGAELLNFSYVKYWEKDNRQEPYFTAPDMPVLERREDQLEYLFAHGLYIASPCNKIIARRIFDEGLTFAEGVHSEDVAWSAELLLAARSFDYVNENFYMYRQREGSSRYSYSEKHCTDRKDNIMACLRLCEQTEGYQKRFLQIYTAFQFATFFVWQARAEKVPVECINELAGYKGIMKYSGTSRKVKLLHMACCVLGYRNLCRLIRLVL